MKDLTELRAEMTGSMRRWCSAISNWCRTRCSRMLIRWNTGQKVIDTGWEMRSWWLWTVSVWWTH